MLARLVSVPEIEQKLSLIEHEDVHAAPARP
jgi:hypothetical protein